MTLSTHRPHGRNVPSPTHCEPEPQPCSTCGMLECLCRPRFFAGQILTADDLNRLSAYIRKKHRMHNRQLHGWGVVNGLEVTCDACGPGVVVGCGYALSPCGDDVIVCEPVAVDVCDLIDRCRTEQRRERCDPPRQPRPSGCEEGEEEWILAIRYRETPAHGVKPLHSGQADCGCGSQRTRPCSCGGSSRGSCSCGNGNGASRAKPRGAPVQCEPTVVCEGFEFEVYRKPPAPDAGEERVALNPDSELVQRFECCAKLLIQGVPKFPGEIADVEQNPGAWHDWLCTFKDALERYLSSRPGYNCELLSRLQAVVCPMSTGHDAAARLLQAAVSLFTVWLDALLACFCSALLPPCPVAHSSDLVPLASVRVRRHPCRVLSICNWTVHRKIATTFPSLQYWLSVLPFGEELRRMIDRVCCFRISRELPRFDRERENVEAEAAAAPEGAPSATAPGASSSFEGARPSAYERATRGLNPKPADPERLRAASALAARAFARGRAPLDPQTLFESVFLRADDKEDRHLDALEITNLPQFLALNQILRPIVSETVRSAEIAHAVSAAAFGGVRPAPSAGDVGAEVAELRAEVSALRDALVEQAEEIRRLRGERPRP